MSLLRSDIMTLRPRMNLVRNEEGPSRLFGQAPQWFFL